jgi:hypothetical protein
MPTQQVARTTWAASELSLYRMLSETIFFFDFAVPTLDVCSQYPNLNLPPQHPAAWQLLAS